MKTFKRPEGEECFKQEKERQTKELQSASDFFQTMNAVYGAEGVMQDIGSQLSNLVKIVTDGISAIKSFGVVMIEGLNQIPGVNIDMKSGVEESEK